MAPRPVLALFVVVGTLAYLGLAVLGWGSLAAFLAKPARVALVIVVVVLSVAALFSSGNLSPGEREDRGNRWVIGAFGVIGLIRRAWNNAFRCRPTPPPPGAAPGPDENVPADACPTRR